MKISTKDIKVIKRFQIKMGGLLDACEEDYEHYKDVKEFEKLMTRMHWYLDKQEKNKKVKNK